VSIAIVILFLTAFAALLLGLYARHGHDMNLEEWSVGGRSFGDLYTRYFRRQLFSWRSFRCSGGR